MKEDKKKGENAAKRKLKQERRIFRKEHRHQGRLKEHTEEKRKK